MTYHGHLNIIATNDIPERGMVMTVADDFNYKKGDMFYYGNIWEIVEIDYCGKLIKPRPNHLDSWIELTVRRVERPGKFPLAATPREPIIPVTQSEIRKVWMWVAIGVIIFWSAVFYFGCS